MTIEQAMHDVEIAIRTCKDNGIRAPILVIQNKKIYIQPAAHLSKNSLMVMSLEQTDLREGLLSDDWNRLQSILTKLIKENVL